MRQITSPLSGDLRYYTRLNLVTLLHLAKTNIVTDWATCMNRFVEMVRCDRQLPIGQNSLQELMLNLHMYGVWEDESPKLSPLDLEIVIVLIHGVNRRRFFFVLIVQLGFHIAKHPRPYSVLFFGRLLDLVFNHVTIEVCLLFVQSERQSSHVDEHDVNQEFRGDKSEGLHPTYQV